MDYGGCVARCHEDVSSLPISGVVQPREVRGGSAKMLFPVFSTYCLSPYQSTEFRNKRNISLLTLMSDSNSNVDLFGKDPE